ncbi:MAG: hypothetical protein AB1449_06945 [Chloroflexota bacterium]
MERELPQPDRDRLSVLTALVLLTYALLRVVVLPALSVEFSLLGLLIRFNADTSLVLLTLAAALTAAGADWLIRSHPWWKPGQSTIAHLVVPALAAMVIGAILIRIPEGLGWWLGLLLGAALLVALLATEFVVFDPDDPRHEGASVGLTALAYLLLVAALFALLATGPRATFSVPLVFGACALVSWRLLRLQQPHVAVSIYAGLIGIVAAQIAWGLHYWPLPPLRTALLLALGVYLGTGLVLAHLRREIHRATGLEFLVLGGIALAGILLFT